MSRCPQFCTFEGASGACVRCGLPPRDPHTEALPSPVSGRDPTGGTHRVECYCPACAAPVSCRVVGDVVVQRQSCPCDLPPDWLSAIDRVARRKAATARFFRRLMGEGTQG